MKIAASPSTLYIVIELHGTYGSAKIFTDQIEEAVRSQVLTLLNHPVAEGAHVRIMPDCHAGAGCVIGYTAKVTEKVVPNLIGVDIGCGVCGWKLRGIKTIDFSALDEFIRKHIPSGQQVRGSIHPEVDSIGGPQTDGSFDDFQKDLDKTVKRTGQDGERVWRSLGTLGGGNHFIEVDTDGEDAFWLLVHSGSRNFGLKIAEWHQRKAAASLGKMNGLEYLAGQEKNTYLRDMALAQEYAARNRRIMGYEMISSFFGLPFQEMPFVESVHNYISFRDNIVRKGAISAAEGEPVIIPLNMAEGSLFGRGKGNRDWNNSAPHGAGRKMSRRQAKKQVPLEDFRRIMKEHKVWSSCVGKKTLDESPQAYKETKFLKRDLEPSVEITAVLVPVYNFKAAS